MNAWDWFTAFMFAVLLVPMAAFTVLYWLDERRVKRDNKSADAYEQYNEATRRYREWR